MIDIELSPIEIKIGEYLGKQITEFHKGSSDKKAIDKRLSQLYKNTELVLSEMSLCKVLNVYPKETFFVGHRSLEGGSDFGDASFHGHRIDVKSTRYEKGRLAVVSPNKNIDVYILMTGEKGKYSVIGGMYSKDLFVPERHKKPPNFITKSYIAEQSELIPIEKLLLDMKTKKE